MTKLITLVVKDVRINKDIGDQIYQCNVRQKHKEKKETVDFRNKKIPNFITTFAQVCLQVIDKN